MEPGRSTDDGDLNRAQAQEIGTEESANAKATMCGQ